MSSSSSSVETPSSEPEFTSSAIPEFPSESISNGESSGCPVYPQLVLSHASPYQWDAVLSIICLGGTMVQLDYDIRAKCKWDRVIDYADKAALQAAIDDIKLLAQKSLRPRVPSKYYDQHLIDIENYLNNL